MEKEKTEPQGLLMIIKKKRAEIAQMIAQNSNWRNIGLYFEHKNFAISEAYLKAKCGEYQPSLNLCEQLIEELASRNISTEVLINVLREPNIGMNNIADNVAAIASNNDYLYPSEAHAWSSIEDHLKWIKKKVKKLEQIPSYSKTDEPHWSDQQKMRASEKKQYQTIKQLSSRLFSTDAKEQDEFPQEFNISSERIVLTENHLIIVDGKQILVVARTGVVSEQKNYGHEVDKVLIDDKSGQLVTYGLVSNGYEDDYNFVALQNIRTRHTIFAGNYWATPNARFEMIELNGRSAIFFFEWSKKMFYVLDILSGAVLSLLDIDWGGKKLYEWRIHQNSLYFTLLEDKSIFRVADICKGINVEFTSEKQHPTYRVKWENLEHIIQVDGSENVYQSIANVLCNPRRLPSPQCLLSHNTRVYLFDLVYINGIDLIVCCDQEGHITVYKEDEVWAELDGPKQPVRVTSAPNMFVVSSWQHVMLFVWNGTKLEVSMQESLEGIHSVVIVHGHLCIASRKSIHLVPIKQ